MDPAPRLAYGYAMDTPAPSRLERLLERSLFASRWLMAPVYFGLAASLLLLLVNFAIKAASLVAGVLTATTNDIIIGVLSLIDMSLVANLVLIVVWAGYVNFISSMGGGGHKDRPEWITHVGYADLKLKLMTSIVAISAVEVLEDFMHVEAVTDRELYWSVGIHVTFVFSALMLAVVDWVSSRAKS